MPRTLQQAAQCALDVQDACNLSGVVRAFSDILFETLWPAAHAAGHGTEWVNKHAISVLFSSKIASLTGSEEASLAFAHAYDECHALAANNNPARHVFAGNAALCSECQLSLMHWAHRPVWRERGAAQEVHDAA